MIVFVDPKHGRGGGQVVLEGLLSGSTPDDDVAVAMPPDGRASISIPAHVTQVSALAQLSPGNGDQPVVLVANANSSFIEVGRAARRLRRRGLPVVSLGIVHNYPSTRLKAVATRVGVGLMDQLLVVEPGLLRVAPRASVPSWLSISPLDDVPDRSVRPAPTGMVKSFGRPDSSKGLHLLADIFPALEAQGLTCRVALGVPLDGQRRYQDRLRSRLAPWLEETPRTSAWIQPGDIFMVPSVSGEAACLSAQEAISRGAWVVASQIGLMPYLSPRGDGISTFPVGDTQRAISASIDVVETNPDTFAARIGAAQAEIISRQGAWYRDVWCHLRRCHESSETA